MSDDAENPIVDATSFTEDDYDSVETLSEFLDLVKPSQPYSIPLERLLRLNGNLRRGKYVTQKINSELESRRLLSEPPIERADYYGTVIIHDPRDKVAPGPVGFPISALSQNEDDLVSAPPTERIGKIKTLMLMNDYSQIPIIDGKNLVGSVTWKSIAQKSDLHVDDEARKAMSSGGHVAESSDDLFELVPRIIAEEFIYFRDNRRQIKGIVTASDLAQTFQETTGHFLRIGEIENRLRALIDKLPLIVIEEKANPGITRKNGIKGARDLTFGEYIRILEDKEIWESLKIPYDRVICVKHLIAIKDVRNDVMHFNSGNVIDADGDIEKSLNWLRALE